MVIISYIQYSFISCGYHIIHSVSIYWLWLSYHTFSINLLVVVIISYFQYPFISCGYHIMHSLCIYWLWLPYHTYSIHLLVVVIISYIQYPFISCGYHIRLRGRVVKGVGHLDHVRSYGVQEVVSSIPDRGNIVG